MGTLNNIYSGTADFGKLYALWGAIIGTIVCIVLIILSIIAFRHKPTLTAKTFGTVTQAPDCTKGNNNVNTCSFNAVLDSIGVTVTIKTNEKVNYKVGDRINTIYYNPNDTSKAALKPDNETTQGIILLVIGIFGIIISWTTVWLTNHFKAFAAVEGASGMYNIFKN